MRILLANKFWRPLGGVEEHAFVVKATLEEAGHEVVPFSMMHPDNLESDYDEYFVSNVDFRDASVGQRLHAIGRASLGLQTVRNLRRLLRNERIDAAHVLHTYHQMGMSFMLELRRQGIPTVLSLHDYKIACPNYRLFSDRTGKICTKCIDHPSGFAWAPAQEACWDGSRLGGAMLSLEATANKVLGSYTRGPGAVIVLNELQRRAVVSAGVPAERVHLIPHYVAQPVYESLQRDSHVLYVGRLVPEKGVDVLIRACAQAGLKLRVIGDGRDRASLTALSAELGADVEFVGSVAQETVGHEMRRASVVAVPSLWHEVSPLVVVEAITHSCPVVGTRTGGIPDLIGDGRGTLVEPGDVTGLATALRDAVTDRAASASRALKAVEFAARHWTRERWASRVEAAYAQAGADLRL